MSIPCLSCLSLLRAKWGFAQLRCRRSRLSNCTAQSHRSKSSESMTSALFLRSSWPRGVPSDGLTAQHSTAQRRSHPIPLLAPTGRLLFAEAMAAGHTNGFFKLIEQYSTQDEPAFWWAVGLAGGVPWSFVCSGKDAGVQEDKEWVDSKQGGRGRGGGVLQWRGGGVLQWRERGEGTLKARGCRAGDGSLHFCSICWHN